MAIKTKFDIYLDSIVAPNTTDIVNGDIIELNKTVRLLSFGGLDPNIGDDKSSIIAIQYGFGTSWKTIRAGGDGTFDFKMSLDFKGDGQKRFRLVRRNNSATAKALICWLFAVII